MMANYPYLVEPTLCECKFVCNLLNVVGFVFGQFFNFFAIINQMGERLTEKIGRIFYKYIYIL